MTFKEFLQNEELKGLFGPVNKVGGSESNLFKHLGKDVRPPDGVGRGKAIRSMLTAGPKVSKPPRPAGPGAGPTKPMTIPSVLKGLP